MRSTPGVEIASRFPNGGAGGTQGANILDTPDVRSGARPRTQLLSNGRYGVMVTAAGGGYSRWNDVALTRWREDGTRDNWGAFLYVFDPSVSEAWSAMLQPVAAPGIAYQADFSEGGAVLDSRGPDIDTRIRICVCPDSDIELRQATITNRGGARKTIDLCSYAEVVLASPGADKAHPAFNKLFVQTEVLPDCRGIICHRRPGADAAAPPWMFHQLVGGHSAPDNVSYETDRLRFIGRGNTAANPRAMTTAGPLSGTQGSVLDPVVAIRCRVAVEPGASVTLAYVFGVAGSRQACIALMEQCARTDFVESGFRRAARRHRGMRHDLGVAESALRQYQRLADHILYAGASLRAPARIIEKNRKGQSGLWRFSISGDLPIVLLRVGALPDLGLLRQVLQAHAYWRLKGLAVDLVLIGRDEARMDRKALHERVMALISQAGQSDFLDKAGGLFVQVRDDIPLDDRVLLGAVARVVLDDAAGTLATQIDRGSREDSAPKAAGGPKAQAGEPAKQRRPHAPARTIAAAGPGPAPSPEPRGGAEVVLGNGLGGFSRDGREYIIRLDDGRTTPAPWVNVLANPVFGTLVSESGAANSWYENAHEFRLTPWSNDPVSDSMGEAFYIRDDESGRFWSPTRWPCPGRGRYECRHGFGYSVFTHAQEGLRSELTIYVARAAPVKFAALKIFNASARRRRISVTGYVEWVLGDYRDQNLMHVVSSADSGGGTVIARNAYSAEFGDCLAFFQADDSFGDDTAGGDVQGPRSRSLTGDRLEFIGRNGTLSHPAAMERECLSGTVGAALDPCAAIRVPFDLAPGQARELVFRLGACRGDDGLRGLLKAFRGPEASRALADVKNDWRHTLEAVQVETPEPALDALANGWLLYQTLACRVWARSAFYQPGGAFGFRDQLQDVMALVHARPDQVRGHILLCASRQFPEGDVQHWWHPPRGRGVRTRCSDDYLWLPLAVCRYVRCTGDAAVLDEQVPFLQGRPLKPGEDSYYELPARSGETATLYQHCVRAIRHGLCFGAHGLPLMGTGDWNDGMNKVGERGSGESVWLAFFLHDVLRRFSELARSRDDPDMALLCDGQAASLRRGIERHGWDGAWFRRAYFDDGTPLGSARNTECQIDSIAQSWAVFSDAAGSGRLREAMDAVDERLVDRDHALVRLLAPAFDHSEPDPGYIRAYVPGVRENGGQYTHAAVWAAMAFARLEDPRRAWELLEFLNPVNHSRAPGLADVYKVEPYVVASDVYALPPHAGRGGWTWYSGSAGWLYRLIVESILGLRRVADRLYVKPCMPGHWSSFILRYRYGASTYIITVRRARGASIRRGLSVDGAIQDDGAIALVDQGRDHVVECIV